MKILVTGGAGFIGSHISRMLLDQGHQVVVYDNLSTGRIENLDKRSLFIQGDLANEPLLTSTLNGNDAVIHMASSIEVSESVKHPLSFTENNVLGTIHLLESMKKAGVKKIIFSSSACVYGTPKKLPIDESASLAPDNPYGATKVSMEAFISSYFKTDGIEATILRYFNPYGPGEMHDPETHAIPNFVKSALEKKPIPLYWKGEQIRDFIYIEDLARAHISVLDLSGWNVFNVGTEKGVKVADVVKTLEDILGYKLEINDLGERAGDVRANYASSKKLRKETKWKPRYSLREGLEKTVKWFSQP